MNSLTPADLDFDLTATSLVGGSWLDVRVAIDYDDDVTGTVVEPVIYEARLELDIRG